MNLEQFTLITDVDEIFNDLTGNATNWRKDWVENIWLKDGVDDYETTRFILNRYIRMKLSTLAEEKPELHSKTIQIRLWLLDQGERFAYLSAFEKRIAPFMVEHGLA